VGIDASPVALGHTLARGLHAILGSVDDLPFERASFDAVLSLDVLYHQDVHPEQAVAEIARVLKPGGVLIVNVPAFAVLRGSHDRSVSGARRYNACQVQGLLERHNLKPDIIHYWNGWLFLPLLLRRLVSRLDKDTQASDLRMPPRLLNQLLTTMGILTRGPAVRFACPSGPQFLALPLASHDGPHRSCTESSHASSLYTIHRPGSRVH